MTTNTVTSDGRDWEGTVPRNLVTALIAQVEMSEEATDRVEKYLAELDKIANKLVKDGIGEGRDIRAFVGSIRDHLLTITRPVGNIGTRTDIPADTTCGRCEGSGKVDDLRTCHVCNGYGINSDVAILQVCA